MERDLERAFISAMNKVIGGKDSFFETLVGNIYNGIKKAEHEHTQEQLDKRLAELQQELMGVVRLNAKTGADVSQYDNEYAKLAEEIEEFRAKRQVLLDKEAEDFMQSQRIEELKDFLRRQDSPLKRFNGDLLRRLIEKVRVKSLVEVTFVFKTGDEVREILG